jgi:heme-degrading monooxygenase HmoA
MVSVVNCFTIPAGREETFVQLWQEVNACMAREPGYADHRLHRSLAPDAQSVHEGPPQLQPAVSRNN